jgi:hypothetical protein
MHRSGTSAVARLLAHSCERTLLEDPFWAMTGRLVDVARWADELARWDLVKCPRMTEVLPRALAVCPQARAAVLVRDPRDVFCSILEKANAGMPTRMLEFSRLGVRDGGADGFSEAYGIYARTILDTLAGEDGDRVRVVVYERFCDDKPATVSELAAWMGWPCDPRACAQLQDHQLGPANTKHESDRSIKGPRRWSRDLGAEHRARLVASVEAYTALCEVTAAE